MIDNRARALSAINDSQLEGIQSLIDSGDLGGSMTIDNNHFFADDTARDTYFTANPTEKVDGVFISVGTGYQQWDGTAWTDKTAVVGGATDVPIITFIHDDGSNGMDLVYDLYKSNGFVCNFALIPDTLLSTSRDYISRFKEYEAEGFGILSHSANHLNLSTNTLYTVEQAEYEIAKSKVTLEQMGFKADVFVAANNAVHEDYLPFVRQNYSMAYTVYKNAVLYGNSGHVLPSEDRWKLYRGQTPTSATEADMKEMIDNCISSKGFLTFYGHTLTDTSTVIFQNVLDYLKPLVTAGQVKVLNAYDAGAEFFGISYNERELNKGITNMAPPLTANRQSGTTVYNGEWLVNNEVGTVADSITSSLDSAKESTMVISLTDPVLNTKYSITTDVPVALKTSLVENSPIYVSFEAWSDSYEKITTKLKGRCWGADSVLFEKEVVISEKRRRYEFVFTNRQALDTYTKINAWIEFEFSEAITGAVAINVANPKVCYGNDYIGSNAPVYSDGFINRNTGMYGGTIPHTLYTWFGTSTQYTAIVTKDVNTAYFVQSVGIYVGDTLYLEPGAGGGGAATEVSAIKSADQTKTEDIVLAVDADLQIALEADSYYEIKVLLLTRCDDATDMSCKLSKVSGLDSAEGGFATAHSSLNGTLTPMYTSGSGTMTIPGTAGSIKIGHIIGYIRTGASAGTLGFDWCQHTSGVGETTLLKNSLLMANKLA